MFDFGSIFASVLDGVQGSVISTIVEFFTSLLTGLLPF